MRQPASAALKPLAIETPLAITTHEPRAAF